MPNSTVPAAAEGLPKETFFFELADAQNTIALVATCLRDIFENSETSEGEGDMMALHIRDDQFNGFCRSIGLLEEEHKRIRAALCGPDKPKGEDQ